MHLLQLLNKPI